MGRKNRPQREQAAAPPPASGVGRRWALGALGAGALAAGGGWYLWAPARPARAGNHPEPPPGASFPATLSPALFVGKAAAAYQVAREIPQTLARIYCYCGCDKLVGHKSLLYCFSDDHGSG
jgi:hypothetical protein